MTATMRAAFQRASVFLRGPRPNPAAAAALAQPVEELATPTAPMRAAIKRALVFLRGPRPNPAAAAAAAVAQPAEELATLMPTRHLSDKGLLKKRTVSKRGYISHHSRRIKKADPGLKAIPWLLGTLLLLAFLEGSDQSEIVIRENAQKRIR